MFCIKCGNSLSENDRFCTKCGYKVQTEDYAEASQLSQEERERITKEEEEKRIQQEQIRAEEAARIAREREEKVRVAKEQIAAEARVRKEQAKMLLGKAKPALLEWKEKLKKEIIPFVKEFIEKNKKTCQLTVGVLVAVLVIVFLYSQRKLNVDINEFVTLEIQGYSGIADAVVTIDEDGFLEKYRDAIKKHTDRSAESIMRECGFFEYELSQRYSIGNGDTVTLTWKSDIKEALKEYKIRIKCDDIQVEVAGLEERELINIFDYIEVVANGVSGSGTAHARVTGGPEFIKDLRLYVYPDDDLSNGDEVEIDLDGVKGGYYYTIPDEYQLVSKKQTYVISGLSEYVNDINEISEEITYKGMWSAEVDFSRKINENKFGWNEEVIFKDVNCIGHFLVTAVDEVENRVGLTRNRLGLIYKIDARIVQGDETKDFSYYYPIQYANVEIDSEGNNIIDYQTGVSCNNYFSEGIDGNRQMKFPGYMSFEEMMNEEYYNQDYMEPSGYMLAEHSQNLRSQISLNYLESTELLNEQSMEIFFVDAKERFMETTDNWSDAVSINYIKNAGAILWKNNMYYLTTYKNILGIVLEVNVEMAVKDMKDSYSYYVVIGYTDAEVLEDGRIDANKMKDAMIGKPFKKMLGDKEIWEAWKVGPSNVWIFNGFQSLEEVSAFAENYVYENFLYLGDIKLY